MTPINGSGDEVPNLDKKCNFPTKKIMCGYINLQFSFNYPIKKIINLERNATTFSFSYYRKINLNVIDIYLKLFFFEIAND